MIKAFAVLFFLGFLYGIYVAHLGGAMISLALVPFMLYADHMLNKRDREYVALPESAKQTPDALEELRKHDSESAASRL